MKERCQQYSTFEYFNYVKKDESKWFFFGAKILWLIVKLKINIKTKTASDYN
jgi:hypothetical protein